MHQTDAMHWAEVDSVFFQGRSAPTERGALGVRAVHRALRPKFIHAPPKLISNRFIRLQVSPQGWCSDLFMCDVFRSEDIGV